MLLQQIIAQFDVELDRLYRLRTIVAGLQSPPMFMEMPQEEPALQPETRAESSAEITAIVIETPMPSESKTPEAPARQRMHRMPRQRLAAPAKSQQAAGPSALTSSIPSGPVIVSAKALAEELQLRSKNRTPPAALETTQDDTKLESLSRNLADRWVAEIRRVHG